MSISERIKYLRKELNLSQQKFADELNIKRNSISLIENGKRNASERTLNDICEKFDVNIEWLKTGKGEIFIKRDDFICELVKKYNIGHYGQALICYYLSMDNDEKLFIENIIKNFIAYYNNDNTAEKINAENNINKKVEDYRRQLIEELEIKKLLALQESNYSNSEVIKRSNIAK